MYNPLFLYSGPGLGKTHLMHSISRYIIENHPEYKIRYTTSENFTNDVVTSIRESKSNNKSAMTELRDKYRNVDVLLIDDIQFIIDKESTLQEFFHTFEELFQTGRQLVISSDKPPSEMDGLEDRYKTRFASGLPVDIKPPDYETALAILMQKQDESDVKLSNDILSYIASNARHSIRELKGAYNKVILFSKLTRSSEDITLDMAENALKDFISDNAEIRLTAEYIIDIVCSHFHVDKDILLSDRRTDELVYPRQIAMYLCSQYTSLTQQVIAQKLKRKNHTTVQHGVKKIKDSLPVDNELQMDIIMLKKKLNVN